MEKFIVNLTLEMDVNIFSIKKGFNYIELLRQGDIVISNAVLNMTHQKSEEKIIDRMNIDKEIYRTISERA